MSENEIAAIVEDARVKLDDLDFAYLRDTVLRNYL